MNELKIGKVSIDLVTYATQGNAVLGIRGTGKTYTATWIAEQMLKSGIPWIAFDPIGVWRYLKVPGKGKGSKVVVAGGEGQDLPLTEETAPEIVRSAMQQNIPLILDLYDMKTATKAAQRRIVEKSVEVLLYENKGLRHVFIEEAAEFVPQQVGPDCGKVYAMIESLVRMGGNRSIGCTLINQRAEQLNKSVLELCACLFLHGQKGKNSITSLQKWLNFVDKQTAETISQFLPVMGPGECWVWPQEATRPVHVQRMPEKDSLHPDRKNPQLHALEQKKTDVGEFVTKLQTNLADILEKKKADDPAELRKRIRDLEKQVKEHRPEIKEVPVLTASDRKELNDLATSLHNIVTDASKVMDIAIGKLEKFKLLDVHVPRMAPKQSDIFRSERPQILKRYPQGAIPAQSNGDLSTLERDILRTLVQYPEGLSAVQVALHVEKSHTSGHYNNMLGKLRSRGYIAGMNSHMTVTADGKAVAGNVDPLPTGEELLARWVGKLDKLSGQILQFLAAQYPSTASKEAVAECLGYSASSGHFKNMLGKMRTLGVIQGSNAAMKASDNFFR
jgi:protein-arginine kinase activator protein McsA